MKILHVNTNAEVGGAAIAAQRVHYGLLKEGIHSVFLFKHGIEKDKTFKKYPYQWYLINKIQKKCKKFLLNKNPKSPTLFSIDSKISFSANYINSLDVDIVHLHWVNNFLTVGDIAKINKPIVWSLHDMNPFTGGCHYDEGCDEFKANCIKCRVLNAGNSCARSQKMLETKLLLWKDKKIIVNGLSNWIAKSAKESKVFSDKKIINIPNPIDTNIFKNIDKGFARKEVDIPHDKKIILFGAWGVNSDLRKGHDLLEKALRQIKSEKGNISILLIGELTNPKLFQGFNVVPMGFVSEDEKMNLIYSAADIFISPSRQENLSNMILESLASGTPVLGFDIGGNKDMITHKLNGFLAKPYSTEDLAKGIDWMLENDNRLKNLSHNARETIINKFDNKIVIPEYIELYRKVLKHPYV